MNEDKKRPRISLLLQVGLLLLVSGAIMLGATALVGIRYRYDQTVNEAISKARAAAHIGHTLLDLMDADDQLEYDAKLRDEIHDSFRDICKEMGVEYLYLYKIDKTGLRTHIISAGESDEDEANVADAGFGTTSDAPIRQQEQMVFEGRYDEAYGFVNNKYGNVCAWADPIFDEEDELYGIIGADYSMNEIIRNARSSLIQAILIFAVLFLLAVVMALYLINSAILSPLKALSTQMANFIKDRDLTPVFGKRHRNDEIADIGHSFDKMAGELKQYLSDVERLTTEKVAGEVELSVAKRIQEGMVRPDARTSGPGFEVAAFMHPAKEIGGDFYDYIPLKDGEEAFIIGDVSGKGVTAAIFMVLVRTLIKDRILMGRSPAEALRESNDIICDENPEGMFATVFVGRFQSRSGRLSFANAGHTLPFIFGKEVRECNVKSGIALGLFEDADIYDEEMTLDLDCGILLYTDGVTEAINVDKVQFGTGGIEEVLQKETSGAGDTIDKLLDAVATFTKGVAQFDDLTALALYRVAPEEELKLEPKVSQFDRVKDRIFYELPDTPRRKDIILACEEWFANVVMYSGSESILVRPKSEGGSFIIEFEDKGVEFDPVSYVSGEKDFEDYDQGGMGIIFMKNIASKVEYRRVNDKNILRMVFSGEDK